MRAVIGAGMIVVALFGGLGGGYFLWEMTVFGPAIEDLDSQIISSNAELNQNQEELEGVRDDLERARADLAELLIKPDISLIDIGAGMDRSSCYFGGILGFGDEFHPEALASIGSVQFTIINTGEVDGFVNIEMVAGGQVVSSNRYFVIADDRAFRIMTVNNMGCTLVDDDITVRIVSVQRA